MGTHDGRLQGRTAIITGAGRGIGRATALELSGRGYRLALAARGAEALDETARLERLDQILGERNRLNADLQQIIDEQGDRIFRNS